MFANTPRPSTSTPAPQCCCTPRCALPTHEPFEAQRQPPPPFTYTVSAVMNGQASEHMNSTSSPISSLAEPLHRHVVEEALHEFGRRLRRGLERRADRPGRNRKATDTGLREFARHS